MTQPPDLPQHYQPEYLAGEIRSLTIAQLARVHGRQEGGFYHGYYNHYCFLPLYITCGGPALRPTGNAVPPEA